MQRARRERRSGNLPEMLLWRALRDRPGGLRFRRQHPELSYALDFACLSARVAIEVDGQHHGLAERAVQDAVRDAALRERGWFVLRVAARDVLGDLGSVVAGIVALCEARVLLHQPAAGPPPRAGEV